MRNKILFLVIVLLVCPNMLLTAVAQEKVFANYFDIPVNSPEGTEVIGRIHLERNKDVLTSPIPAGYHFEILKQADGLFNLETRYDLSKRIMGVLTVAKGQSTGSAPSNHRLTIALKDGDKQLKSSISTSKL